MNLQQLTLSYNSQKAVISLSSQKNCRTFRFPFLLRNMSLPQVRIFMEQNVNDFALIIVLKVLFNSNLRKNFLAGHVYTMNTLSNRYN